VLRISWHDRGERDAVVMLVKEHVLEAGRHLSRGSYA
jgi:hypothetical protein